MNGSLCQKFSFKRVDEVSESSTRGFTDSISSHTVSTTSNTEKPKLVVIASMSDDKVVQFIISAKLQNTSNNRLS